MGDISTLSLHKRNTYQRIPFGKEMLKQFPFDPKFKNLNHGMQSYIHIFNSYLCRQDFLISSRFIRSISNRSPQQSPLVPRTSRSPTRPIHPLPVPQDPRRVTRSHCQSPQRPRVNRSIRAQRNHSREHRPAKPSLEPRRQRRNPLLQHHLRRLRQSCRLHLRSLLRHRPRPPHRPSLPHLRHHSHHHLHSRHFSFPHRRKIGPASPFSTPSPPSPASACPSSPSPQSAPKKES
jgi:hypothetical protein